MTDEDRIALMAIERAAYRERMAAKKAAEPVSRPREKKKGINLGPMGRRARGMHDDSFIPPRIDYAVPGQGEA